MTDLMPDRHACDAGGLEPVDALFPGRRTRIAVSDRLTRDLQSALERVDRGRAPPSVDFATAAASLDRFDFAAPVPLTDLLPWAMEQVERGTTHMTHPRYFGLFNPALSFPAECADRIVNAFNPQLATATTSPAAVAIENHVIAAMAARIGLPAGAIGHFTTGGSEANFTAVICALTQAHPDFAADGARAFSGQPVCYASRESHLAWLKIAHQAGIGRSAVRLVETDGRGRMDPASLEAAIAADLGRGAHPFMIAATAGTTNAGMVDPLREIARIAQRHRIWMHADAAWGGALVASERLRHRIAGIELADSITIDAHKWLATTMGCGMFFTAHAGVPPAAFNVAASYMPSNSAKIDPYVTSVLWSRRFSGLRLFLSLAAAGWEGYAAHVEKSVAMTGLVADALATRGWQIANDPSLAVACVVPPSGAGAVAPVVKAVLAGGQAWISAAELERRPVIRICATNGMSTRADAEVLVEALVDAARSV